MPLFVATPRLLNLAMYPIHCAKVDMRTQFVKDTRGANWPFTTSQKGVAVNIRHRPLSHVARSCRTTQHSPFLSPRCCSSLDSSTTLEKSNRFRTDSNIELAHRLVLNIMLCPSLTSARNRISESVATHGCRRDTVHGGAVATGVATPLYGRRLFSWHGRVASRDTTVREATWHGVSGRGASEACRTMLCSVSLASSV